MRLLMGILFFVLLALLLGTWFFYTFKKQTLRGVSIDDPDTNAANSNK
jgi:hypothetical protein